ncbi:MAG: 3'(2'),5'-bisphosphate nucleotidase [Bacteroidetes bacterium RIFCSPLOWO2_12_FULL_35_15]|nr:MAG: 3'(2'),5'-bisphosphate nucleotidase [Bacteroidetes bacterium RIFCSPLOWO2_12_FULL_35_15]
MEALLFIAIEASLKAGEEILKVYESNFAVEHKDDTSPLTLADKNAHNIICENLKKTDFPVLSEEGKLIDYAERSRWKYFWMVDPLDGTKEFVKRNGEFTVNIALIHQQRSILGVIYVPVTKTLYFAAEGIGSYKVQTSKFKGQASELNDILQYSEKLPLKSTKSKFTIVASRSHLSEETEMFIDGIKTTHKEVAFISSGSSIKLCLVAEGSADIYPRFAPTMEWDTAAGQAICEIAGKLVIDYSTNKPLLYNKQSLLNNWFIVQ